MVVLIRVLCVNLVTCKNRHDSRRNCNINSGTKPNFYVYNIVYNFKRRNHSKWLKKKEGVTNRSKDRDANSLNENESLNRFRIWLESIDLKSLQHVLVYKRYVRSEPQSRCAALFHISWNSHCHDDIHHSDYLAASWKHQNRVDEKWMVWSFESNSSNVKK